MFDRAVARSVTAGRRGVVAIEFAFVGLALMAMVVGIVHIGFTLYAQSVLDYAAATLARTFQTGAIQNVSDITNNSFRSISVCPVVQYLLNCDSISVVTYAVADYTDLSAQVTYSPGAANSLMILKMTYISPVPSWPVLNGLGSTPSNPMLIVSKIPYVNEYKN